MNATEKLELRRARARERQRRYRERLGRPVGVGKGGSNKRGAAHHQFSSGRGEFVRLRKEMRRTIKECERCGVDLSDATRHQWCVHHKDHDQNNNVRSNLEMLCKRCHQIEHDCHKALNR